MPTYTISNTNFINTNGYQIQFNKIPFIKTLRAAFNISLKEAKDIADQFSRVKVERREFYNLPKIYSLPEFSELDPILLDIEKQFSKDNTPPIIKSLKEVTKEAIDNSNYSIAISLIQILKEENHKG